MPDLSLEHQVLLALGWHQQAWALTHTENGCLPTEPASVSKAYVEQQRHLAAHALATLKRTITDKRQAAADAAQIAFHKRSHLLDRAGTGKLSVKQINEAARQLERQFQQQQEAAAQYEYLLQVLEGALERPVPILPLHRYSEALKHLRQAPCVDRKKEGKTPGARVQNLRRPGKCLTSAVSTGAKMLFQRTDRSDRIALTIALILCVTIFFVGSRYIYYWGEITLETVAVGDHLYRVTCVNTTAAAIQLHLPYDGQELPVNQAVASYGIRVEIRDAQREPVSLIPETLWTYKEQPAHLYGPVVVGPLSAAELHLNVAPYIEDGGKHSVTLMVYQAPQRYYATYPIGQ